MKKIFGICLLLIIAQTSMAISPVNLGLKAGYTSSKITTSLEQFNDGSVNKYLAGAFVRVNLGRIYIQPEGYFSSKGGVLKNVEGFSEESFDLNTIDVPLLLGYQLVRKSSFNLRVNAGPVFSFITDTDDSETTDLSHEALKDHYVGIQYGAGIDYLFLSLDARMESSLEDIYSSGGDEKLKLFSLTLGIKFL
ncbi:outer membrane protein with beta-barrel domain [Mangrovibacterium marinum]|uniref:Outer membrane protein with beta-barrel domain n=1 Tax=Mangrovibacterium marinum TaxID=1639118 RepID=A0A2T5C3L8_9BACT|nr:porin family protein [Mangrovibacterium marinum]PTN09344.1 outer membrane protein with beta-barrel domain [Mangrovibacterium marinum]